MSKYSTQRTFDGRRARCGDIVVLACRKYDMRDYTYNPPEQKMCLRAGVVGAISSSKDLPYLRDLAARVLANRIEVLRAGSQDADAACWEFVTTRTEEDIEKLEIGQWTWPLDLAGTEGAL